MLVSPQLYIAAFCNFKPPSERHPELVSGSHRIIGDPDPEYSGQDDAPIIILHDVKSFIDIARLFS